MTVRVKATLITTLTIGGLIAALYASSRAILLESFARLESRTAASNLGRARDAILEELKGLDATCADWAYWDETYAFAGNGNRAYVEANLTESALANLQANVMLFLDASGRLVYGIGFDLGRERKTPLPSGLLAHFAPGSPLLQDQETGEASGIVSLPDGLLLLSARPVLKNDRKGPVAGTLAFGRYLDIEHTSAVTHLTLTTTRAVGQDKSLPHWGAVRPLGADKIVSSGVLDDIYGEPGLVLSVTMPRAIYQHGRSTVFYLLLSLIAVGLVSELVAYALLDRAVLVRLSRLSAGVRHVAETGNAAERLSMSGRDELADLAGGINAMLETLERAEAEGRASERRLWKLNECFLRFGSKADENIQRLVEVCGELLGGICALYNRRQGDMLCTLGKWRTPPDLQALGPAEGHICADVIAGGGEAPVVLRNLPASRYAKTDPNVARYGLQTYVGSAVKCGGAAVGSLCVVYQTDAVPEDEDLNVLSILAAAIGVEEERKQAEATIRYQAYHDLLTNLPNRALFWDRLAQALAAARRRQTMLAVLILDLDRFKDVNDKFGHQMGDELLRQVAERLRNTLRQSDSIARLGGDEFAILVPDISGPRDAATVAGKVVERLTMPFHLDGRELHTTGSVGVSLYPGDGRDTRSLIQKADIAMYRAKEEGRNSFRFYAASGRVGSVAGAGAAVPR